MQISLISPQFPHQRPPPDLAAAPVQPRKGLPVSVGMDPNSMEKYHQTQQRQAKVVLKEYKKADPQASEVIMAPSWQLCGAMCE